MIAEIDERELERMLHAAGDAVVVPEDGPAEVLRAAARAHSAVSLTGATLIEGAHARHSQQFWTRALAAAAAMVLVVGVAVAALGRSGTSSSSKASSAQSGSVPS